MNQIIKIENSNKIHYNTGYNNGSIEGSRGNLFNGFVGDVLFGTAMGTLSGFFIASLFSDIQKK